MQQLDISVQLNKNIIGSANFTFGIGSTTLIESINLNISLGPVTFHIVPINILFLFCLAVMDKLRTFFNNITNEVI